MAPLHDATGPVGECNIGKVICKGTVVQHWLHGKKVVHFDYADPMWTDNVELLRLHGGDLAAHGANLILQDHGNPVWYRNIKLRTLGTDDKLDNRPVEPAVTSAKAIKVEQQKLSVFSSIARRSRSTEGRFSHPSFWTRGRAISSGVTVGEFRLTAFLTFGKPKLGKTVSRRTASIGNAAKST